MSHWLILPFVCLLQIAAENDPEWAEYTEMRSISEIAPGE